MHTLNFEDRVAIVTGAGSGLGRAHALLLASRGARVVVNDVARVQTDGTDRASLVCGEIASRGGVAIGDTSDISTPEGADALVRNCVSAFGHLDILINNAGFVRDRTLAKMDASDFEAVIRVHLMGSAWCSKAALAPMRASGYGRIVMTTSAAGLYGNFGQTNYAAAKMGVVGLMRSLRLECAKQNILVNALAPAALTPMTEATPFAEAFVEATPEHVAAAAAFLASDACEMSGVILVAVGRHYGVARVVENDGWTAAAGTRVTPEAIASHWAQITGADGSGTFFDDAQGSLERALRATE